MSESACPALAAASASTSPQLLSSRISSTLPAEAAAPSLRRTSKGLRSAASASSAAPCSSRRTTPPPPRSLHPPHPQPPREREKADVAGAATPAVFIQKDQHIEAFAEGLGTVSLNVV